MKSRSLQTIQKSFGKAIRGKNLESFSARIIPGGRLNSLNSVNVYREGYTARLTSSLGETFETIWRILGDDEFFFVCAQYIEKHDSASYNLSDYGEKFPRFLKKQYEKFPYLEELARFELLFKEVFHAEYDPPFDMNSADLSEPEKTYFRFSKSTSLMKSKYSIFELWNNRLREDFEIPAEAILHSPENYLLYRRDHSVYCEVLDKNEMKLIKSLMIGNSLSQTLNLFARMKGVEEFVARLFGKIVHMGIVSEIFRRH